MDSFIEEHLHTICVYWRVKGKTNFIIEPESFKLFVKIFLNFSQ